MVEGCFQMDRVGRIKSFSDTLYNVFQGTKGLPEGNKGFYETSNEAF